MYKLCIDVFKIGSYNYQCKQVGQLSQAYRAAACISFGKKRASNIRAMNFFSLGVTAEPLRAKRDQKSAISLQRGQFDPKFQLAGVVPH